MSPKSESYGLRKHWKMRWEQDASRGRYTGNVHRDAAQLKLIGDDIGYEETKELIDFYFKVRRRPDFMWFLYNYDKLQRELDELEADRQHRETLREATRRRMEELQSRQNQS